ncbi:MAG: metallophosphoesterase [Kiritimatiellae bacterium]|nr:metallophosphoesterase [Kiritimatiellia bacterium]
MKYDPSHTFVTSDHHFGLWKVNTTPWHPPVFSQAEEEEAIAKWNSVVKPTDLVLYVGDFCDSGEDDLRKYRKRLNGSIVLVKGNHDKLPDEVYESVFQGVHTELVIEDLNLVLHHEPDIEGQTDIRQIYGHIHEAGGLFCPQDPKTFFCSCVTRNGGFPVSLESAIAKMASR